MASYSWVNRHAVSAVGRPGAGLDRAVDLELVARWHQVIVLIGIWPLSLWEVRVLRPPLLVSNLVVRPTYPTYMRGVATGSGPDLMSFPKGEQDVSTRLKGFVFISQITYPVMKLKQNKTKQNKTKQNMYLTF